MSVENNNKGSDTTREVSPSSSSLNGKHAVKHEQVLAYKSRIEDLVKRGFADKRALEMFSKVGKHMMGSPSEWNDPSTAGREGD